MLPVTTRCARNVARWKKVIYMKMAENPEIPNPLSCLLFVDGETKRWVAHCLDFDLATSGRDEDAAWSNLKAVVRLHVEHCFTHWQDAFKKKAPEEDFIRFAALKEEQKEFRSEKISFKLVPPKAVVPPLWMHGIEGRMWNGSPQSDSISQIH